MTRAASPVLCGRFVLCEACTCVPLLPAAPRCTRACFVSFSLARPPAPSTSRPRVALSSLLARASLTSSSLASSLLPLRSQFRHTISFLFQAAAREWLANQHSTAPARPGGAGAQQHGDGEEDLVQSLVFQRSVQERIMHTLSIPALFAQLQHRLPRLKICRPTAGAASACVREGDDACVRACVCVSTNLAVGLALFAARKALVALRNGCLVLCINAGPAVFARPAHHPYRKGKKKGPCTSTNSLLNFAHAGP